MITGPSGVGKGTLIRGLRERLPELELSVSATTRAPRPGERDGVDYHFLSGERFDELLGGRPVRRARRLRRTPLRDAALGARGARAARACRWCSRSRSRAPARCARRCPQAVQVFIAPPSLEVAARAAAGRGEPTTARRCSGAWRSPSRSSPRSPSSPTWSSTTTCERATGELYEIVTAHLRLRAARGSARGSGHAGSRLDSLLSQRGKVDPRK